jgi:hypothetical protein
MSKTDDLARAEALLAQVRRSKTVSLRRVRRVADIVRRLRSNDAVHSLLAALSSELLESVQWWEGRLVDRVERVCLEHPIADVSELASIVARDREFRRLNRLLRWNRAVYLREELPEVHVRAHVREGRKVREHWRLVGYGHLTDVDLIGRDPRVQAAVRSLVSGTHRRR